MKKRHAMVALLALGLALVGALALADPGNSNCLKGKGKFKGFPQGQACVNRCPPPAPGCVLFECTACGCSFDCAEGEDYVTDYLPEP